MPRDRSIRKAVLCLVVALFFSSGVSVFGKITTPKRQKNVRVDCDAGQSINAALATNVNQDVLTIEISGFCVEDVVVNQDRRTFKGSSGDRTMDGIRSATTDPADDRINAALTARGDVTQLYIEQLTLEGGVQAALAVFNIKPIFRLVDVDLVSDNHGADVRGARMFMFDSAINVSGIGIRADQASVILCQRCTINAGRPLDVAAGSVSSVFNSTLTGPNGVRVRDAARLNLTDSTIMVGNTSGRALDVRTNSAAFVTRGSLEGFIQANDNSMVETIGTMQTTTNRNRIQDNSYWRVADDRSTSSPLASSLGEIRFQTFSNGNLLGESDVDSVSCFSGADVSCDPGAIPGSSSCGLCAVPVCGNNVLDLGEGCDDGNTTDLDGCSSNCLNETGPTCGNSSLEVGEACDDGNTNNFDGCSSTCIVEFCGDNIIQASLGEDCDDGNAMGNDGCSATCTDETCGNDRVDVGEECDDGNSEDLDGCSNSCTSNFCGDGDLQVLRGEQCDDGNLFNGDGCSPFCTFN